MPQDVLLNNDYDLDIKSGDFVVNESTRQHKVLMLICEPGEFRQWPEATVGVQKYLDDDALGELEQEIRERFENDDMIVKSVSVSNTGTINTDANYTY